MRSRIAPIVFGFTLLLGIGTAQANESCAAVMCLSGKMAGNKLAECQAPINEYFKIKKYRKKKFDSSATAKARKKYIDKCKSKDSAQEKRKINSSYGFLYGRP